MSPRRGPEMVLYRIVRRRPAPVSAFRSDAELGKPPRPEQETDRRLYEGISTFDRPDRAIRVARQYNLGAYLAELHILPTAVVRVERTRTTPGHYSVTGPAEAIHGCVGRTEPLDFWE